MTEQQEEPLNDEELKLLHEHFAVEARITLKPILLKPVGRGHLLMRFADTNIDVKLDGKDVGSFGTALGGTLYVDFNGDAGGLFTADRSALLSDLFGAVCEETEEKRRLLAELGPRAYFEKFVRHFDEAGA